MVVMMVVVVVVVEVERRIRAWFLEASLPARGEETVWGAGGAPRPGAVDALVVSM